MAEISIINTPKHIVYNGNLYELIDTNVVSVTDIVFEVETKEVEDGRD